MHDSSPSDGRVGDADPAVSSSSAIATECPADSAEGCGSLRQRRKAERPQELLDAALELFVEKGFAATRSAEVAARAGVSKGTLYLYFQSKEELLKAVIRHTLSREIAEGAETINNFKGCSADLLAQLVHDWWQRIGETRASGICKLMVSESRNFPNIAKFYVDEVVLPFERMLVSAIDRGVRRGEFRDVPRKETVHVMMAPMLLLMLNRHSIGACPGMQVMPDPQRLIHTHIALLLHGLAAPTAPALALPAGLDGGLSCAK